MMRVTKVMGFAALIMFVYTGMGVSDATVFPTADEIESAWAEAMKMPSSHLRQFSSVLQRIRKCRSQVGIGEVERVESLAMSKVFSERGATTKDEDVDAFDVLGKSLCLIELSRWDCLYADTNRLMRMADNVAQYPFLPDLRGTRALQTATQLDDIIEYGTNGCVRKSGMLPQYGSIGLKVVRISDMRAGYNQQVEMLRKRVLKRVYESVIQRRFVDMTDAERQSVLREFLRRAAVTDAELRTLSRDAADMRWIEQDVHPGGVNPPADDEPNGEDDHTER